MNPSRDRDASDPSNLNIHAKDESRTLSEDAKDYNDKSVCVGGEKERTCAARNAAGNAAPKNLLISVRQDIDRFVKEAPQFDDITMLCFELNGSGAGKSTMNAQTDQITPEDVRQFLEEILTEADIPRSAAVRLYVAADEIVTNILHYSGAKTLDVCCCVTADDVAISFSDDGTPYNPLEREDPDVTLSAEERSIGGLGIFMVKNTMDDVKYEYLDGRNVLTVVKKTK